MPRHSPIASCLAIAAIIASLAVIGCATRSVPPTSARADVSLPAISERVPVVRSGRYTLIEVGPEGAQRDLMRQVIDVTAPQGLSTSVADMLRYVLLRSGYSICEGTVVDAFATLPLPIAHFHLGPLTLRDALMVLAGPTWELAVNDERRQVCFTPTTTGAATDLEPAALDAKERIP